MILQGKLAREIAQAIRIKLTPQEQSSLAALPAVNRAAYEAFLKGRYFWSKRTEETTKKAIGYFQEATEKDPHYALGFTGLADSYISLALSEALQEAMPPKEAFPKARDAAESALQIDDNLAEAHASMAHIKFQYDRDWSAAEKEFQRAIVLNSNYANAHQWYALTLMWRGRLEEALVQVKRAQELDPLSLVINANLGFRSLALSNTIKVSSSSGKRWRWNRILLMPITASDRSIFEGECWWKPSRNCRRPSVYQEVVPVQRVSSGSRTRGWESEAKL